MNTKKFFKFDIPSSVVGVVISVCNDYERRRLAIEKGDLPEKSKDICERINDSIDGVLEEIEPGIRRVILRDISCRRGYRCSQASGIISENAYYRRKHKIIHDIAQSIGLI